MPVIGDVAAVTLERILFATDFSEASAHAASYAQALALRFNSTVNVVHVYDPDRTSMYENGVLTPPVEERIRMRNQKLHSVETRMKFAGVKTTATLTEGHPAAKELLHILAETDSDLIVVGTHSKTGLERFVLGSTAESLIRNAPRPVLTIGPHTRATTSQHLVFKNIVYATDFSQNAARAAAFAISFAEDSRGHLYYCHVTTPIERDGVDLATLDHTFLEELRRSVPESTYERCTPEVVIEHGNAAHGILELAHRVHADLIVLGPRKATLSLTYLERGVTASVLAKAECPVLTFS